MAKKSGPICQVKATRCLKVPLKSTEQIYLVFLIPTLVSCFVYIVHFSADLVVAEQHFREENSIWGCCTLGLMYAPAISYFILTVSRPDWWMPDDDKISKGVVIWFILQICQLVAFPLFALYRYAGLIVLSVDAIMLSGKERTKTLNVAAKPAAIELYFFLQAWFQAAPQAIFQTHLLFKQQSIQHSYNSAIVRMLCIFMSIVVLSVETMSFQRFESQRVNGRKLPWAMWLKKYRDQELEDIEEEKPLQSPTIPQTEEENLVECQNFAVESSGVTQLNESQLTLEHEAAEAVPILERQVSSTPPLPPRNAHVTPPPMPLRGITSVAPLPIPEMSAPPRPDSIVQNLDAVETIDNSRTVVRSVSIVGSTERSHYRAQSFKLPKRKYSTKGLEEDDPIGRFLAFLWWFFFISPRIFSIVVFYEFHPGPLMAVLGVHYVLMLIYLFYYAKDYDVTTFFINLWLGLVYIIGAIEYKIKFKYADKWLITYYTFVMLQNTFLTIVWYYYDDWDGFWYNYIFYATFVSMGLCIMSTMVYHILLKPKKRRVYAN